MKTVFHRIMDVESVDEDKTQLHEDGDRGKCTYLPDKWLVGTGTQPG